MKFLTPVLATLISLTITLTMSAIAIAQNQPYDPERQAEIDARDNNNPYAPPDAPPFVTPGHRPPAGYNPGYADYGPGYTVRWQDFGMNRLPKFITQDVTIQVRGQLVNEIILRALDNQVEIQSALAYLTNGQVIDLRQVTGTIGNQNEVRVRLDYRYSLRVERIVFRATSSNLFGSRGQLSVILGLAN